ncbi:hypothetical protein [[Clostridium] fimetarium]|uniref:Uncharacterized protein n=1 Tax=[Clostridium] fimetarium TaxID=99656 RepID=A0A1I0RDA8_9FIRM|nr:hypothetical protein [[Clostridium] fimetarium]SEW38705.1 hypothetical protein SAMN05421659_11426 [[Clostridium] fimetarium]
MTISDKIQLGTIITTTAFSIIAIIISIRTLRQNSKMLEESTRPVLSIYGESIDTGNPSLYLVIKNFGTSTATISKFYYDFDFTNCYCTKGIDFLGKLKNCTIAPGQSRICLLEQRYIDRPVKFDIEYKSTTRTYNESFTVDIKAGVGMPSSKNKTPDMELQTISFTLQEMLQKNL